MFIPKKLDDAIDKNNFKLIYPIVNKFIQDCENSNISKYEFVYSLLRLLEFSIESDTDLKSMLTQLVLVEEENIILT